MNPEIKSALFRILPFAIVLIILLVSFKAGKNNPKDFGLIKPVFPSLFVAWIFGFIVFVLLEEVSLNYFKLLQADKWNHPLFPSIIRIFGAVLLAPIVEEMIFRGLFMNKLIGLKISKYFAIIIQAVLFVLLHNFAYDNTISSNIGIVQSFIDACLFGVARLHTRSLYTSMGMHISGNLVATIERFLL